MTRKTYIINGYLIDLNSGFMTHRNTGETKRLGEYQLKLLTALLQHAGKILSRDEITSLVWQRRVIGNNSLPNAIHTLRLVLGDKNKQQRIIQTIPKMGYSLDPSFCEIVEDSGEQLPGTLATTQKVMHSAQRIADTKANDEQEVSPIFPLSKKPLLISEAPSENLAIAAKNINPVNNQTLSTPEGPPLEIAAKQRPLFSRWAISLLLLSILIIGVAGSYIVYQQQTTFNSQAVEQNLGMYSNTRVLQLLDSQLSLQDKQNLNQCLKKHALYDK